MLDDIENEAKVKCLIYQLMLIMYQHGFKEVHMGGMMRLLGVDNAVAASHDDEVVVLDDKFAKYVETISEPRSSGQTLH